MKTRSVKVKHGYRVEVIDDDGSRWLGRIGASKDQVIEWINNIKSIKWRTEKEK